ncbi:MAG: DNA-3-methyladenine glycosylase [Acidimicrobiales bacterium]
MRRRILPRSFYEGDPREVAATLLGKLLVGRDGRVGRIVEVEAYCGADDPASHAYRGMTPRNATMFGPPGHLYVYFTYGMHFCANVVCWPQGVAGAVLLRGVIPVSGVDQMRVSRQAWRATPVRDAVLTDGPAKLCQAFGIDLADDGADLVKGDRGMRVFDDGVSTVRPTITPRVGVTKGAQLPWRFHAGPVM